MTSVRACVCVCVICSSFHLDFYQGVSDSSTYPMDLAACKFFLANAKVSLMVEEEFLDAMEK